MKTPGFFAALLCAFLGVGCVCWTDTKTGARHTLILGFGFCSHSATNAVNAHDLRAAGLVLDRGFSAGIVQRHEVSIDPEMASNTVVQFKSTPFSLVVSNWSPRDARFSFLPTNTLHE